MDDLLKFVELTQEFKAIQRKVILAKENRQENDAEHSYQLAMIAWYIITKEKLDLDVGLAIKYALTHDLIEVYAGDTPAAIFTGYESQQVSKIAREKEAAERLKKEFPQFTELHELMPQYDLHENEESKFVYALDKLLPILNIYLDEGHSWKVHKIPLQRINEYKKDLIALSPPVKKYFDLIIEKLRLEEGKYFGE